MKYLAIFAWLFLMHISEATIFDSSLHDYFDCGGGSSTDARCQVNVSYSPTDCKCLSQCPECGFKPDPNNFPNGFIDCSDGSKRNCPVNLVFNSATCTCISCPACGSIPDPFNAPSGSIYCKDGSNRLDECPRQSFNSSTCGCDICPAGGYVLDPYNAPSGAFYCKDGSNSPADCPLQIFNITTPGCDPCPSSCDYIPDPYNAPSGFMKCVDGCRCQCTAGQSFDSKTCSCVSTPVDPCAKCGYYAYPGDTTKYYKCVSGGTDVVYSCPSGYYFNPATCYCEGTPPNDPCAKCGYYEYPGDNTKYYKCVSGGSPVVGNCPTGFTFNPNTCYCE